MTPKALRTIIRHLDSDTEGEGYNLSLFLKTGVRLTGTVHAVETYNDEECIHIGVVSINGKSLAPEAECLPAWIEIDSIAAVMVEG
jgi:hypothetical protein